VRGKGWLLVDLETGKVERRPIPWARAVPDLDPIEAAGLSAPALDAQIAERIDKISGGIEGKIVRLKIYNVPRHIARELNHAAIRDYKAAALHFRFDLRRPEPRRTVEEFVRLGTELIEVVEPDLAAT
jgi:hypothetical protein